MFQLFCLSLTEEAAYLNKPFGFLLTIHLQYFVSMYAASLNSLAASIHVQITLLLNGNAVNA
jgi:hypothetical protein